MIYFYVWIKCFQNVQLRCVVVPVELSEVAMLVAEHAAVAVHAVLRMVKGPTVLWLELFVIRTHSGSSELLLAMGEATLWLVAALCCLDPIFAEFCLILAISVELLCIRRHLVLHGVAEEVGVVAIDFLLIVVSVELRSRVGPDWDVVVGFRNESVALWDESWSERVCAWAKSWDTQIERTRFGSDRTQESGYLRLRKVWLKSCGAEGLAAEWNIGWILSRKCRLEIRIIGLNRDFSFLIWVLAPFLELEGSFFDGVRRIPGVGRKLWDS